MTEIINFIFPASSPLWFCAGIFLGYALSRKQQDKPIVDKILRGKPYSESVLDDYFERAKYSETELKEMESGRIPTMRE